MLDVVIASLGYVGMALEEMEKHMCFISDADRDAFRGVVMASIPDHGHFYGGDKDNLVNRVLNVLSDDSVVANLDFSKLTYSQKNRISKLFWEERYIYRDAKEAIAQMKKILGR